MHNHDRVELEPSDVLVEHRGVPHLRRDKRRRRRLGRRVRIRFYENALLWKVDEEHVIGVLRKLGFKQVAGNQAQNWLILQNSTATIITLPRNERPLAHLPRQFSRPVLHDDDVRGEVTPVPSRLSMRNTCPSLGSNYMTQLNGESRRTPTDCRVH
jgi:hypothetical protein